MRASLRHWTRRLALASAALGGCSLGVGLLETQGPSVSLVPPAAAFPRVTPPLACSGQILNVGIHASGVTLTGISTIGARACPHWTRTIVLSTGQSLGVGNYGPLYWTTQPYQNVMFWADSGNYDFDAGDAAAAFLKPLVVLPRLNWNGSCADWACDASFPGYPGGPAGGEGLDVPAANQLTHLAALLGSADGTTFQLATSNIGLSGRAIADISQGGVTNSFQAGVFETTQICALTRAQGGTCGVLAIILTTGEADVINPNFEQAIVQLQSEYAAAIMPITGQTWNPPIVLSQTNSGPGWQEGGVAVGGTLYPPSGNDQPPLSPLAQAKACNDYPKLVYCSNPSGSYPPADGIHKEGPGYDLMGESDAFVLFKIIQGLPWLPLMWGGGGGSGTPAGCTRTGNVVHVSLNVPYPPAVFDPNFVAPHGYGTLFGDDGGVFFHQKGWTGCGGVGCWKNSVAIGCQSVSVSPDGLGFDVTCVSQPDQIEYAYTPDAAFNLDAGLTGTSYQGGRTGTLRDSRWYQTLTGFGPFQDAGAPMGHASPDLMWTGICSGL